MPRAMKQIRFSLNNPRLLRALLVILFAFPCVCDTSAQGGSQRRRGPEYHRGNVPEWELDPKYEKDCFTFLRLIYRSTPPERSSRA